jgi:hypothetical protein
MIGGRLIVTTEAHRPPVSAEAGIDRVKAACPDAVDAVVMELVPP